eukprot:CAMPEP_0114236326 /NCGR_PEP_ID=MMETSP0058-20121206/6780_1 /TAXON_ID=36894 /ORGANISM="Pyramimonas parkeae, CCMP726" /LENGTH=205 /DNA_ID=CAMNT_0001348259 /DNA_START=822 /DNA_END=1436 /DNA_ORIENTATION=-
MPKSWCSRLEDAQLVAWSTSSFADAENEERGQTSGSDKSAPADSPPPPFPAAASVEPGLPPRSLSPPPQERSGYQGQRVLYATFATAAMSEFLLNWIAGVRGVGVADSDILVGGFDPEIKALCEKEGVPLHRGALPAAAFKGMATGGMPLGGSAHPAVDARPFQEIGILKTTFVMQLLEQGHRVMLSDVDTAWMRDARHYLTHPA